jgi:hypothetical protein
MKFEDVSVPLVPRSTGNCIDLALCFMRHYLKPIASLWATVAVPSCLLVYVLADRFEWKMSAALLVFFFASSPLGVLLMAGAAPCVFGEKFNYRSTMQRVGWSGIWLMMKGLALRCLMLGGFLIFIFPGWYLGVKYGFMVEQAILSRMARHLHDRRADELLQGEVGDLIFRSAVITGFCTMLWWVLLKTVDFACSKLLGWPILLGRFRDFSYISEWGEFETRFLRNFGIDPVVFWTDPVVITVVLAVAFAVYAVGRLAWFFCYIDVRVRRDCWDMELKFLQEAQQLEVA